MELPVKKSPLLAFDMFYIKTRQIVNLLVVLPFDVVWDMTFFLLHCRLSPFVQRHQKDKYDLIFFSHTIEKGLSLPNPHPIFGKNNIARVLHLLRNCDPDKVGKVAVQMAIGSLNEYLEFHNKADISDPFLSEMASELTLVTARHKILANGGTKDVICINQKIHNGLLTYGEFLASRYSSRAFHKDPVPKELLEKIIQIAQQAPSQCNRQSARLHLYQDKQEISNLLTLQGGARGFSTDVSTLFVISNDLNSWVASGDRNQGYLDSGLFAMSLLFACHAHGLATCPLNFSKTNLAEHKFKKAARIPNGERVVMLVAVGFPANTPTLVAARSVRSPIEDILNSHCCI
jgi:nitroreductase